MPYRSLAILLTLLVLIIAPLGARAEEAPVKLGLTPVDVDGSYFDLEMQPGDIEVLTVELANFGEEPVEIKSFAADAYSLINGGFGVRLVDEPQTGSTHWLDFTVHDLTLEPDDPVLHTFTVEVPEGAAPGDYLTSIVIQTAEPVPVGSGDSNVGFNQTLRQAVAVAIDVPGPREPLLAVDGATHTSNSERSVVRIGVENPGNQHLRPLAGISIEDSDGALVYEQEIQMRRVYAGTKTAVEMIIDPALEPGDYCANLELADETTGATASSEECLSFTVEAPPEPEVPEDESAVGTIIDDPRLPGDGGISSLLWLLGILAAVAALATIIGVLIGRRRGAAPASTVAAAAASAESKLEPAPEISHVAETVNAEVRQTEPHTPPESGLKSHGMKSLRPPKMDD